MSGGSARIGLDLAGVPFDVAAPVGQAHTLRACPRLSELSERLVAT
jgi:hypothetical protein